MHCEHCNGNIIRDAYNQEVCLQCGRSEKPKFIYKKRSVQTYTEYDGIKDRPVPEPKRIYGMCCNCKRTNMFLSVDYCGTCRKAITKIPRGTPEYEHRLKVARERLNPKKFRRDGYGRMV